MHDEDTVLQVYKNGILQREGGSNDYVTNAASDTVTMTSSVPSGNTVTIITVENTSANTITGLMTETNFTDTATGKIPTSKLQIADGDIAQAKVVGLVSHIASAAKLTTSGSTPSAPATGDLWLDTSQSPNVLKFYDGAQFLQTSPESGLPTFSTSNAGQVVQVNGTGTALQYAAVDLSSRIATTQRGAANGVASLLIHLADCPLHNCQHPFRQAVFTKLFLVRYRIVRRLSSGYLNNAYKLMQFMWFARLVQVQCKYK